MDTRMTRHDLLLDVGGTFIKCPDGRSVPVDSDGSRDSIVMSLKEAVGNLSSVARIAVAIPGPFDYGRGVFLMKHKYRSVYGENFSALVDAPPNVEFRFIHDVNCMLLGEMYSGAGKGYGNVAMVSLGTGLGFSMYREGKILENAAGSPAVSIYMLPFRDGVLEDYASKRGFLRLYSEAGGKIVEGLTVKDIAEQAKTGNPASEYCFREAGHIIGKSISSILEAYDIECLLFGGQISKSFDLMEDSLRKELANVGSLKKISAVSDFDNATFSGLQAILHSWSKA